MSDRVIAASLELEATVTANGDVTFPYPHDAEFIDVRPFSRLTVEAAFDGGTPELQIVKKVTTNASEDDLRAAATWTTATVIEDGVDITNVGELKFVVSEIGTDVTVYALLK